MFKLYFAFRNNEGMNIINALNSITKLSTSKCFKSFKYN